MRFIIMIPMDTFEAIRSKYSVSSVYLSLFRKNYSAPRSFQTSGSFFQYGDRFDRMALIRICKYIIHNGILNKYPFYYVKVKG